MDSLHFSPAPSSRTDARSATSPLLKYGFIAMLVLACAIPFAMNVVDPDLWGHVRYGQDWIAAGALPRTATHTFTAEGYPWINHENAFEYSVAWGYDRLGIYGLLVAKCLLGLGVLGAMVWTARRHGVPAVSAWFFMVLVASNLQAFFPLRPQLFSFALCAVMLVLLDRAFQTWFDDGRVRFRWLLPLPLVMAAWVNSHGGFAAGLCILGAYLLGRIIEGFYRRGRAALPSNLGLAAIGLASLAATVANPYGFELHRWMARAMLTPQPEITEWLPPSWNNPVFMPFLSLSLMSAACLIGTTRRRDWTQIAIMALVGGQACLHLRHIAFFALTCGFWIPPHWHATLLRLRPDHPWRKPALFSAPKFRWTVAALLVLAVAGLSDRLARRLSDFPVYRSTYPVDALQYMVDQRMTGKLVVAFNWAQYALAALAPEITVGFDGRFDTCYPDEVIDAHFDFLLGDFAGLRHRNPSSGPLDRTKILRMNQPDLVLIDRQYKEPTSVMRSQAASQSPEWTLLYSDAIAQLWGRTDKFDNPHSPHYLPPSKRRFDVKLLQARFQWPALPDRSVWDELVTTPASTVSTTAN